MATRGRAGRSFTGGGRGRVKDLGGRKAFAVVTPGLESVLVEELQELGVSATETEGGATFQASWDALDRVCRGSAIAQGLRLRLARVKAGSLEELAHGVRSVPWASFVSPRQPLKVSVSSFQSRLKRASMVSRKVERAVADALRGPRLPGRTPRNLPVAGIHVRIIDDRAELSVTCDGDPLHQHGWRQATAKAPIRENLAAAILRGSGWKPGSVLVDPMCGSGTFGLLAARRSRGLPPRLNRAYAYESFPTCPQRRAAPALLPAVASEIYVSDRDQGAIRATQSNARRAEVDRYVTMRCATLDALPPPGRPGWVISNLPYGQRVGRDADIERFYAQIGHILRDRWVGWRVAFVATATTDPALIHRGLRKSMKFKNGGIPVAVWTGKIG